MLTPMASVGTRVVDEVPSGRVAVTPFEGIGCCSDSSCSSMASSCGRPSLALAAVREGVAFSPLCQVTPLGALCCEVEDDGSNRSPGRIDLSRDPANRLEEVAVETEIRVLQQIEAGRESGDGGGLLTDDEEEDDEEEDDDGDEDDQSGSSTLCSTGHSLAMPGGGASAHTVVAKLSERKQAEKHLAEVETGYARWRCGCALATGSGLTSCLEQFQKMQLRERHYDTFGRDAENVHTRAVGMAVHTALWCLAQPLGRVLADGRDHEIKRYTLYGKEVCQKSFQKAVGGSRNVHRMKLSLVQRGHGPGAVSGANEAALQLAAMKVKLGKDENRRQWAAAWWCEELLLHDWLPNEQNIQFKGPYWEVMHKEHYKPAAEAHSGYKPLSRKVWMLCKAQGVQLLGAQLPDCPDTSKIRVVRSARHSNFPECNDCQGLRQKYRRVMSNPSSTAEARKEALDELKAHHMEWSRDREVAIRERYHSFQPASKTVYECDDKCGSQWLKLPVEPGGRDSKASVKDKFTFAVQANSVCGVKGIIRFSVLPKHIRTGSNFGLTCLIMAIWRAKQACA